MRIPRTAAAPTVRTERTRARLLAAALDLFARQGYDRTTVAEIAAAAGVTEMTFYRHFGSKDQLLLDDPYDPLIASAIGHQPADRLAHVAEPNGVTVVAQHHGVPVGADRGAVRDADAHSDADPDADAHAYAYAHSHADADADSYAYAHSYSD